MSMRETDTPVKVEVIEARIRAVPEYVKLFAGALPGKPADLDGIATAIAAYERTLEPGLSPFDAWINGNDRAISDSAKRGFALFNGKAVCVACHGGWRLTDDKFHDIGTTTTDLGRAREAKTEIEMEYSFKTPKTVRRAPYTQCSATLEDDPALEGGIDRPSRSPLIRLSSPIDRQDLVAFMQTLTASPRAMQLRNYFRQMKTSREVCARPDRCAFCFVRMFGGRDRENSNEHNRSAFAKRHRRAVANSRLIHSII